MPPPDRGAPGRTPASGATGRTPGPGAFGRPTAGGAGIRLAAIHLYPVKSTRRVAVAEARVEPRGLAGDRRFMLVDPAGEFVTARKHPRLLLVQAGVEEGGLSLRAPGRPELRVPAAAGSGELLEVRIWGDRCAAEAVAAEADAWFREFLGREVRLVRLPEHRRRPARGPGAREGDEVSFADSLPALLVNLASVRELEARVGEPLGPERFRPNLVVEGAPPFAEDRWREIRIGGAAGVRFEVARPCPRCGLVTADPETGRIHPRGEPLRTLASFRRGPSGEVFFGQNLIPRSVGTLRVGDPVEVLRGGA